MLTAYFSLLGAPSTLETTNRIANLHRHLGSDEQDDRHAFRAVPRFHTCTVCIQRSSNNLLCAATWMRASVTLYLAAFGKTHIEAGGSQGKVYIHTKVHRTDDNADAVSNA